MDQEAVGWFQSDSSALHLLCTSFSKLMSLLICQEVLLCSPEVGDSPLKGPSLGKTRPVSRAIGLRSVTPPAEELNGGARLQNGNLSRDGERRRGGT